MWRHEANLTSVEMWRHCQKPKTIENEKQIHDLVLISHKDTNYKPVPVYSYIQQSML